MITYRKLSFLPSLFLLEYINVIIVKKQTFVAYEGSFCIIFLILSEHKTNIENTEQIIQKQQNIEHTHKNKLIYDSNEQRMGNIRIRSLNAIFL